MYDTAGWSMSTPNSIRVQILIYSFGREGEGESSL